MQEQKGHTRLRLRLIEARSQRGWSQQEVAQQTGTTSVNVSRWERGITRPDPYFRKKLCDLFGKSEQELDLQLTTEQMAVAATSPIQENVLPTAILAAAPKSVPPLEASPPVIATISTPLYDPFIPLPPAKPLVGREQALVQLKQRLIAGGSVALTALNGLPGVGKTALSIALAHDEELRAHFCDGILWAGLGPEPNLQNLLSRWGSLLNVSPAESAVLSSVEAWARTLHAAIGSRRMLLVIDDAWELEDALACKVGGPQCAHLVTTRFPALATQVAADGATVIRELSNEEGLQLLRQLAPGVVEREERKAHNLVQAVGGLPLALTLMGNYLRKEAYTGRQRRITTALERLSHAEERLQISEPHGPVESHPSLNTETSLSLQSVFAVTDQQLSHEVRQALYALSVFPAKPTSFSEEAALAVAACAVATLDVLTDAGILESVGSDRYTLHQTIADYAHLHLHNMSAYTRLIAYVTHCVEDHRKDYELLEQESTIILAALDSAHTQGRDAELVRAVIAFAPFLLLRGLYPIAHQHLQRALAAAQASKDTHGITGVLLYLGEIAQKQGNYALAETHLQEGLMLARQLGDKERISALLNNLGEVLGKRGEYRQAEQHLHEGLLLAREVGDQQRVISVLRVLGVVTIHMGRLEEAETYIQEGLKLARQVEDRERMCVFLINLGVILGEQGKHALAEFHFRDALAIARQIGHREWISGILANLGEAVGLQGNYRAAEEYFQEGLELARDLEHIEWMSVLLVNLGLVARKQNQYIQSEKYLQEALLVARQIGIPQIIANALYEYGNLYLDQHQLGDAKEIFQNMQDVIANVSQELSALAKFGLAQALYHEHPAEARRLGEESLALLVTVGHRAVSEVQAWLQTTAR